MPGRSGKRLTAGFPGSLVPGHDLSKRGGVLRNCALHNQTYQEVPAGAPGGDVGPPAQHRGAPASAAPGDVSVGTGRPGTAGWQAMGPFLWRLWTYGGGRPRPREEGPPAGAAHSHGCVLSLLKVMGFKGAAPRLGAGVAGGRGGGAGALKSPSWPVARPEDSSQSICDVAHGFAVTLAEY